MTINVRHNGFGVDVIGTDENVNAAMAALNSQPDLLAACKRAIALRNPNVSWTWAEVQRSWDAWDGEARLAIARAEGGAG